jgi:molybdenum cofactor cytidylyltransferase
VIAAVVPAAGRSARMGRPKLLMDFEGESLIRRVVTALGAGGADRIIVVTPAESPEAAAIAAEAADAGAEVLIPETQPAEMRDSVELGLAVLDADPRPTSIVLTPGDVPGITASLVARLLEVARENPDRLVIPSQDGHHGHPIVLPWSIAVRIRDLPDDAGVNRLVDQHRAKILEVSPFAPGEIDDIDTPEDLERWHETRTSPGGRGEDSRPGSLDRSQVPDAKMMVRVRLFALAKERAGCSEVEVELTHPATVGGLRNALAAGIPQLGPLCAGAMISVDEEYASDEMPVTPTSRLALIPPVSGGGESGRPVSGWTNETRSRTSSCDDRYH